jgi:AcrR family transcriptional regulator
VTSSDPASGKPARSETAPAGTSPAGTSPARTSPAGTSPAGTSPARTSPAGTGRGDNRRAGTRERILTATVRTLAEHGFARTTARLIAKSGGFTPGVIYYHFADLDDLFVATAAFTSHGRIARYTEQLDGITSAVETVHRLRMLYAEDSGTGHIAAMQELMAAATAGSRLADQVRIETIHWQQLAEQTLRRLLDGSPFAAFVPVRELAAGAVAMYLGMELLSHLGALSHLGQPADLDQPSPTERLSLTERLSPTGRLSPPDGDAGPVTGPDALFDAASRIAPMIDALRAS